MFTTLPVGLFKGLIFNFFLLSELENNLFSSIPVNLVCGLNKLATFNVDSNLKQISSKPYLDAAKKPCESAFA
jgi:hypothetical protein